MGHLMPRITDRSCQARAFKPMVSPSDTARTLAADVIYRPMTLADLAGRTDALVHAPAAFRKHGVYLPAADLDAA